MLLTTVLLWSLNLSVTKYILEHGLAPLSYATARYALAGAIFVALTLVAERTLRIERRHVRVLLLTAVAALAQPGLLRPRARRHERIDNRTAHRHHPDLRCAVRSRARARAAARALLGGRGRLVPRGRARRARCGWRRVRQAMRGVSLGIVTAATWAAYSVAVAPLMKTYSPSRVSAVVIPVAWVLHRARRPAGDDLAGLGRRLGGLDCC